LHNGKSGEPEAWRVQIIVEGGRGSVQGKAEVLRAAGVFVAERFDDILTGLTPDNDTHSL